MDGTRPLAIDLQNLPYRTDRGAGARARIGAIVLATDHTMEAEWREMLAIDGVAFFVARIWNDAQITPDTLAALGKEIAPATRLILPNDESVKTLAKATFDLSEYIVDIARKEGLAEGMAPVEGGVAFHVACHSRAQNIGQKGAELLNLIPHADVDVVERCSGHGGAWGYKKGHFDTAMKIGKPAARQLNAAGKKHVVSECPLAGIHIEQEIGQLASETPRPERVAHPIVLMARVGLPPMMTRIARYGAQSSFTLYAVHFPVMALAAGIVVEGSRLHPDIAGEIGRAHV